MSTDKIDVVLNHHREQKKSTIHLKCSRLRIFVSTIIGISLTITAILLVLFIKPKKDIHRVALLRWNRTATTVAGITNSSGTNPNQFALPWDLVVDWSYTLYVTDRNGNRVQKFLKGQTNASTIAGHADGTLGSTADSVDRPTGIFVDNNGNIYVSEREGHRVQYWAKGASTGVVYAGNGKYKLHFILHKI